jgi:hypothetical protein
MLSPGHSRMWRANPIFCALESLVIHLQFIQHLIRGASIRSIAHALLAERLHNVVPREPPAEPSMSHFVNFSGMTTDELNTVLGEVPKWERGLLLHIAVTFPVLLQGMKLSLVTGVLLTTITGYCYLCGWAAVELLTFLARKELDVEGLELEMARNVLVSQGILDKRNYRGLLAYYLALADVLVGLSWSFDAIMSVIGISPNSRAVIAFCISLVLSALRRAFSISLPSEHFVYSSGASFSLSFLCSHYASTYDPCGTYKPAWIDWLG